jgi:hypothetical protein
MRFFDVNGVLQKARRFVSGNGNVFDDDVKDQRKLAELLRSAFKRLTDIESTVGPEPTEFAVNVPSGGLIVELAHNMNGPVRFFTTYWLHQDNSTSPIYGPALVVDSTSDDNTLRLRSYVAGRAVIRVEQAQSGLDYGTASGVFVPPAIAPSSAITGGTEAQVLTSVGTVPTWATQVRGSLLKAVPNANVTLTADEAARFVIRTNGAITANRNLDFPLPASTDEAYVRILENACTGAFSLIVRAPPGAATLTVGNGTAKLFLVLPTGIVGYVL